MDAELLESTIDLGFIDDVESYDVQDDDTLQIFFDEKGIEPKASVTKQSLNDLVFKKLNNEIKESDAKSRIHGLFMSYNTILKQKWLL